MSTQPILPTRQQIIKKFQKWTKLGSDRDFQFRQVVRCWINCGYFIAELPLLFNVSPEQIQAAIDAEREFILVDKLRDQVGD